MDSRIESSINKMTVNSKQEIQTRDYKSNNLNKKKSNNRNNIYKIDRLSKSEGAAKGLRPRPDMARTAHDQTSMCYKQGVRNAYMVCCS